MWAPNQWIAHWTLLKIYSGWDQYDTRMLYWSVYYKIMPAQDSVVRIVMYACLCWFGKNILDLTRILPSFHVVSDNSHKLHGSHISQQYHCKTFFKEATASLQLDLWPCHRQVGHQRSVNFDQATNYCCVVPVTTFNKGTTSIFVFNSTASLIESWAWWNQMHTIGPDHKM